MTAACDISVTFYLCSDVAFYTVDPISISFTIDSFTASSTSLINVDHNYEWIVNINNNLELFVEV